MSDHNPVPTKRLRSRLALAFAAILMVVASTALAACGTSSDSGGSGEGGDIGLGYTATLSGQFASYGTEMQEGVDLAVKEINAEGGVDGKKFKVTSEDDLGKPGNGPVIAQKFCDNSDIHAVLGYSFSSVALAAVPIYDQCGLPVLASAVTSPELSGSSPFFFRNILSDKFQGREMGLYTVNTLGLKRIAVLNQKDDYGVGTAEGFIAGVEEAGGEILSRDEYQLGTTSFDNQLTKIKGENPDAIYIGGFYSEAAKIAKQARAMGMDQPLLGTDGSFSPDLLKLGGADVEGMYVYGVFSSDSDDPKAKNFVKRFKEENGKEPASWAALAYDAVYTIKAAIEESGDSSREGIAEGLKNLTYDGVTGPTSFDENGDRKGRVLFIQVKNGKFVLADEQ
ncbi:MAG: ABC transporter substrate-binding protein [Solirubrobacterales bacterium]|nr:ABC transporter substrate-binding protein [Solirubrobacterales bacterium]